MSFISPVNWLYLQNQCQPGCLCIFLRQHIDILLFEIPASKRTNKWQMTFTLLCGQVLLRTHGISGAPKRLPSAPFWSWSSVAFSFVLLRESTCGTCGMCLQCSATVTVCEYLVKSVPLLVIVFHIFHLLFCRTDCTWS